MIRTILADLTNEEHAKSYCALLAMYMTDPMGDCLAHTPRQEQHLIETLSMMPHAMVILAYDDATMVYIGMATCFVTFSTFKIAPVINIHDIAVDPQWRGQGIGRKILETIEAIGEEIGCGKITLEVRIDNPQAQALYRSMGFDNCQPPMMFWTKDLTSHP